MIPAANPCFCASAATNASNSLDLEGRVANGCSALWPILINSYRWCLL